MKLNKVKVAYIVPVYNVNKYLDECLLSLSKITTAKEVIIIDDRGSEDPWPIIKPYLKNKSFKYIKNDKNLGLGFARNQGLKAVSDNTTHIYFVDSDDSVDPNAIDAVVNKMNQGESYLMTNFIAVFKTKKVLKEIGINDKTIAPDFVWGSFFDANIARSNPFVQKVFEDSIWMVDFFNKIKNNKSKINYVNETTYLYRKRKQSLTTRKKTPELMQDRINAASKVYKSGIYEWGYLRIEQVWFDYFSFDKKARSRLSMQKFGLNQMQIAWVHLAFNLRKIIFWRRKSNFKDYFD